MKNIKIMMLSLIFVLISLFVSFKAIHVSATTTGTDANGFTWQSDDGVTYSITGYNGSDTNITIPSSIDGHTVTSIGSNAFKDKSFTSVTIPNTVTSIGGFAFYNCKSLVNISIPNSVTSIGDSAFAYCISLQNITLPTNLSSIGNSTFQDCKALTGITIPSSVTSIGTYAFFECNSLTNITIPNGVTHIGEGAFKDCKALRSAVMPDSVTSVGNYLFYNCQLLSSVRLSNNLTNTGDFIFFNCFSLEGVTLPSSLTNIGNSAFENCTALKNITIPNGVTKIGHRAFIMCNVLENVTIPNTVKIIDYNAFAHCDAFTNIIIPDSVTSIGDYAFYSDTSLTEVTIPPSVTSIGFLTFSSCNSNFKIKGFGGSYAQIYAASNSIAFQELPKPSIPTTVIAVSSSYNSINTSWGAVTGASGYEVWRSTSSTGTYSLVNTTTGKSYNNTGLATGTTYYYKVRSYALNGTTKVYSDYSPIVSAKPVLVAPTGVKSTSTGYNSISTSWSTAAGASGYEVWRSASSTGTYSFAGTVAGTVLSYNNTGLLTGTTYYYKVRAYTLNGTTKVYSDYSPIVNAKPVPVAPTGVTSTSTGYNSISTSWSTVAGASGYEVWRATSSTGTYSFVNTTAGKSYNNTGLVTGTTYYYKVRAYALNGTTQVYSDYSPIVSAKPVPVAPTGVSSTSTGYNSISTSWSTVAGASGYEVWRSTSSTGTYSLALTLAGTVLNYNNTGLSTGTTYYYKIRAYRLVGTTKIYGNYSTVVSIKPVPIVPVNFKAVRTSSTSITTSWNAVAGASGYEVYKASSSNGTYSLVKTTTSLSFVHTGLIKGNTYYYKVKAYRLVGTTKIYSNFTNVVYAKTY